jgi:hypothetical protein
MEAAKLEGVHSWLAGSDCGLRQPTSTLTSANATVPAGQETTHPLVDVLAHPYNNYKPTRS